MRYHSEETKRKIGEAGKGRTHSEETKQKMSETAKGRKHTEEAKKKMSVAQKGKTPSKETRHKMSMAQKGNKNCLGCKHSEETKIKISNAGQGRFHTETTKRKISEGHKGEKSYNWKGGITPFKKAIRESFEYKRWRKQCFVRDNFTCQKCETSEKRLEAHHKKPFNLLIQESRAKSPLLNIYNAMRIYKPLWDIGNGVTLCRKCHNERVQEQVI